MLANYGVKPRVVAAELRMDVLFAHRGGTPAFKQLPKHPAITRDLALVADDAVEIRRVSDSLYGTAPELIRHYMELRGIGVIDLQQLFGMSAVKQESQIDLVVELERWRDDKFYDRFGLDEETTNILGVEVPTVTIPVQPGRNLAVIVEVAAMNNRHKKFGYNAAQKLADEIERRVQGG